MQNVQNNFNYLLQLFKIIIIFTKNQNKTKLEIKKCQKDQ